MTNESKHTKQAKKDEADATVRKRTRQDAADMNRHLRDSMTASAAAQKPKPATRWQRFVSYFKGR